MTTTTTIPIRRLRPRLLPRGLSFGRRTYTWHLRKARRFAVRVVTVPQGQILIAAAIAGLAFLLLLVGRPSPEPQPTSHPTPSDTRFEPTPFRPGINYLTAGGETARIHAQSTDGNLLFGYTGNIPSPWTWDARTGRLHGCDRFTGAAAFTLKRWEDCPE